MLYHVIPCYTCYTMLYHSDKDLHGQLNLFSLAATSSGSPRQENASIDGRDVNVILLQGEPPIPQNSLSKSYWCVWKCCVPLNPMVLLIIIPIFYGYLFGNIPYFQTNPYVKLERSRCSKIFSFQENMFQSPGWLLYGISMYARLQTNMQIIFHVYIYVSLPHGLAKGKEPKNIWNYLPVVMWAERVDHASNGPHL